MSDRELLREALPYLDSRHTHYVQSVNGKTEGVPCKQCDLSKAITARLSEPEDVVSMPKAPTDEMMFCLMETPNIASIEKMRARYINMLAAAPDVVCQWADDGEYWRTECGELFCIESGSPDENGMKFCHHCGAKLAVKV